MIGICLHRYLDGQSNYRCRYYPKRTFVERRGWRSCRGHMWRKAGSHIYRALSTLIEQWSCSIAELPIKQLARIFMHSSTENEKPGASGRAWMLLRVGVIAAR